MPKSNKQPVKRASSSRSTATRPPPAKKAKARAKALAKAPIEPEPVAEQDVDDEEEVEAEFEDPAFEPDSEDGGDDDDDSASFYSELSELEQFSDSDGVASPKSPLKEKKTVCIDVDIEGKPIPVSPKQLLHQVLHAVGQLSDGFQELKKSSPLFATSNSKMASVSVAPPNTFILSPSKNSFGNMRSPAVVAATKVVWAKVALHSPNVNLQEVVGAIAIAINLTAPYAAGSISSAFISQMKKALTQLLREVKSSLVGWALDTYIMVEHEVLPPRVPKCHTAVFEARKAIHAVEFKKLLAAPGGYDIDNYSYMHAFHAEVVDGGLEAFANPKWREFIAQYLLRIPSGGRRLNLNNLSFLFVALKARLTFKEEAGELKYGELSDRIYTQSKYEAMQAWLMDADRCPTTWSELIRIRSENPNYMQGQP